MKMATDLSELSPDEETQVGAVMLSPAGRIIATSFNGFLRGAPDDKLPKTREGTPNKYEFIQHAERNMLYNCAYEGIRTKDTTVVCTLSPCFECLRACFQSGVRTIYFKELYHRFEDIYVYMHLKDVDVQVYTLKNGFTQLSMFEKGND